MQGCLGTLADLAGLVLCDRGPDVQHEPVVVGAIQGGEVHAAVDQAADEWTLRASRSSLAMIALRRRQAARASASCGPALGALDLRELGDQLPPSAVETVPHGCLLGSRPTLAPCLSVETRW
jgi:hypothetical protein